MGCALYVDWGDVISHSVMNMGWSYRSVVLE